ALCRRILMTDSQMNPPPEPNPGAESARPDLPPPPPAAPSAPAAPLDPTLSNEPMAAGAVSPARASAPAPVTVPPALDEGTYQQIREPRGAGRLALDGKWHQISPRYVVSQFVQNGIFVAFIVAVALIVGLVFDQTWVWIPAGILLLIELITIV